METKPSEMLTLDLNIVAKCGAKIKQNIEQIKFELIQSRSMYFLNKSRRTHNNWDVEMLKKKKQKKCNGGIEIGRFRRTQTCSWNKNYKFAT